MQLEVVERDLRQVVEEAVSWPVWGSGLNEPTSLALMPKPEATRKSRYWSPGFGSPM